MCLPKSEKKVAPGRGRKRPCLTCDKTLSWKSQDDVPFEERENGNVYLLYDANEVDVGAIFVPGRVPAAGGNHGFVWCCTLEEKHVKTMGKKKEQQPIPEPVTVEPGVPATLKTKTTLAILETDVTVKGRTGDGSPVEVAGDVMTLVLAPDSRIAKLVVGTDARGRATVRVEILP